MSVLQLEPGLNSGSTRVACVLTELSFDDSDCLKPTHIIMWVEVSSTLDWPKCGFHVSACIHACACASAVLSKEMMENCNEGTSWHLGWTQCVELACDHLKTLPRFLIPCILDDLFVVFDGRSARWLACNSAAAAAISFPGVIGT